MNINSKDNTHQPYKHFFCICCGGVIREFENAPVDESRTVVETEPESNMFDSGMVDSISGNYGSKHDTDEFFIAICDGCATKAIEDGRLLYKGNYMFGDIKDKDKYFSGYNKRTRNLNIDDILDD